MCELHRCIQYLYKCRSTYVMLYIDAGGPLRLADWSEAGLHLHVSESDPPVAEVRQQFGVAHVCYAGAHAGGGYWLQRGEFSVVEVAA